MSNKIILIIIIIQLYAISETINSMSAALATRNKENNDLQSKLNEYEKQIETVQKLLNQEKSSNLLLKVLFIIYYTKNI